MQVSNDIISIAHQVLAQSEALECEFLFPFISEHLGGKKVTKNRLIKKGIKRVMNKSTFEVWYEMKGEVITPSFIHNPKALIEAIKDND